MKQSNIKVLEFRKELKKLLKKYNYLLYGSTFIDEEGINILDEGVEETFSMKPYYSDYELYKVDENNEAVNLRKEYILSKFSIEQHSDIGNLNKRVGIITNNESKADIVLNYIHLKDRDNVVKYRVGKDYSKLTLKDGTHYIWITPTDYNRGYKLGKAYIDKDIDTEILNNIVLPMCSYCTRDNITVI